MDVEVLAEGLLFPEGPIAMPNRRIGLARSERSAPAAARSRDYTTGRIERVDLATGRFDRLYESFDAHQLSSPNDLVFDRTGGFWFTDIGKSFRRHRDHSGLYYARPDGSHLHRAVYSRRTARSNTARSRIR
jgi:hypothetical protein